MEDLTNAIDIRLCIDEVQSYLKTLGGSSNINEYDVDLKLTPFIKNRIDTSAKKVILMCRQKVKDDMVSDNVTIVNPHLIKYDINGNAKYEANRITLKHLYLQCALKQTYESYIKCAFVDDDGNLCFYFANENITTAEEGLTLVSNMLREKPLVYQLATTIEIATSTIVPSGKYADYVGENSLNIIFITGGGYVNYPFKGISNKSALGWAETLWGASLTRSNDFKLKNIDQIRLGVVRQLEIKFPIINVEHFVILQKMLHERHIIVDAFYVDDMKRHTLEMAITNNERKTIYSLGENLIGMRDVSIKLVATNRSSDDVYEQITIEYDTNGASGSVESQTAEFGEQINLRGYTDMSYAGKQFVEWNTMPNGTGFSYLANQSITATNSMLLYAIWE
jgi:hypothetical protein